MLDSLSDVSFNKFICLVAFTSLSGVKRVSEAIEKSKQHIKQFTIIVGIDQKATSKEALEEFLRLDVGAQIYYTTSPIIFHPKVYLFEGDEKCRIIIGSSNLTERGLYQNVEASAVVDFEPQDHAGEQFLEQIYSYLEPFTEGKDANVQTLTQELIELLFNLGRIPGESERAKIFENESILVNQEGTEKLEILTSKFPKVKVKPVPSTFKAKAVGEKRTRTHVETPKTWPSNSEILTDRLGRPIPLEAKEARIDVASGAIVYRAPNDAPPNLGTALPTYLSSRIIFLGSIPGQIIDWPRQTLARRWTPVWALRSSGSASTESGEPQIYQILYCGLDASEERPKRGGFSKTDAVTKWKSIIMKKIDRSLPPEMEEIAHLWEEYKEVARLV